MLESQILVLFFALPTASAAYVLTQVLGGDSRLMASIYQLANRIRRINFANCVVVAHLICLIQSIVQH